MAQGTLGPLPMEDIGHPSVLLVTRIWCWGNRCGARLPVLGSWLPLGNPCWSDGRGMSLTSARV